MSAPGYLLLGQRNVAPSAQHASHDVYYVALAADEPRRAFCFGQSIGGGHVEQGGEVRLALDELDDWPGDWREHLQRAGCAQLFPLFEQGMRSGDTAATVRALPARQASLPATMPAQAYEVSR